MKLVVNPYRGKDKICVGFEYPSVDAERVAGLLDLCPVAKETPLVDVSDAAPVAALWVKDERKRMGLGSFKALGAAYVIARQAWDASGGAPGAESLVGRTFVTASAGNHGMSVAAGARVFGAQSVVYIAETVPESFAERLAVRGATVVREGADYAASMAGAAKAAEAHGWTLLSDSSWDGYAELPHILMEGYLQMAAEAARQCPAEPTHVMLQAGVGGLAGAVAAYVREVWGDGPQIVVVEPTAAPALQASIEAGKAVAADGPDSIMGRLDCKEPSLIALNGLARDADVFLTLSDDAVNACLGAMAALGLETTASGGAGLAAVLDDAARSALGLDETARVLCFLSEVPD
ncbi:pyridoxal-phosphate dependent enzyme [Shimia haliotis]|uniref:Diaminopropionate ammonia-lyase n=1 Tax=Shimia haliotis TaxID=1280847 RepID=A0A1I4EZJ7_9RHOB|nr:pyridoxal-phosphate dependent enzyme [Shimia haliotis]SFL11152.1 diaminopropionate ammonia-lyase [Shimia haliotis]